MFFYFFVRTASIFNFQASWFHQSNPQTTTQMIAIMLAGCGRTWATINHAKAPRKWQSHFSTVVVILNCGFLDPQDFWRPGGCAESFVTLSLKTFWDWGQKLTEGIRAQTQNAPEKNRNVGDHLDAQFPWSRITLRAELAKQTFSAPQVTLALMLAGRGRT